MNILKYVAGIPVFTIAMLTSCNNRNSPEATPQDGAITVNLYYTGKDGNAKKFVEEMESSGTADAIRKEEGNLRYEYFFSASDPETVLLIDDWISQEALDAHHATPMMKTISELREKYDLHMTVERYVRDEQGVPSSDQSFIRE